MTSFKTIIQAPGEELLQMFHEFRNLKPAAGEKRIDIIARELKIRKNQLICAVGFNPAAPGTPAPTGPGPATRGT